MSIKRAVLAALVSCAVLAPATASAAEAERTKAERTKAEHCVLTVAGQRDSGELITTEACYATFPAAMAAVGVDTTARNAVELQAEGLDEDEIIIATHYDYWGLSGGSVTIAGTLCLGGYVNLPSNWQNRISSTYSSVCGTIVHYDSPNKTGGSESTNPSGNLSTMNNRAESIQYS